MYNKINDKTYICNNINEIDPSILKENDIILIISSNNFISQLLLNKITDNKTIYEFKEISQNISIDYQYNSCKNVCYNTNCLKDIYGVYINNNLYLLHGYKDYYNKDYVIIKNNKYKFFLQNDIGRDISYLNESPYLNIKNINVSYCLTVPVKNNTLILQIAKNYQRLYFKNNVTKELYKFNNLNVIL